MTDSTDGRRLEQLYPIFKEEVYRRNARIGTITMAGSGILLTGMIAFGAAGEAFTRLERLLCAAGVGFFVAAFLLQVSREGARHAQAKQGLIRIERALGFFEPGRYLPGESLYPSHWTAPPPRERATFPSYLLLATLAGLLVIQILLG